MNPPRPDGSTREHLIGSASALFRRTGVAGAGVGEICRRAGVTKGVFSHHFPGGKDELVVEVVERNRDDVLAALRAIGAEPGRSRGETVEVAFRAYADLLRDEGTDFGCPVAAAVVDVSQRSPRIRAATADAFGQWAAAVADAMEPTAADEADLVVAALEGAIVLARAADDPDVVERVGAALRDLLER